MTVMFRKDPLTALAANGSGPKHWDAPVVSELSSEQALAEGLITDDEALALNVPVRQRLKSPPPNDPLASLTPKQIWHDCIWISDEPTNTKILLLCVGRFMNDDLESSSMSYSQIVAECSFSDATAKRCAKDAKDRWLKIEVHKGFLTAHGRQNLYHGIIPVKLLDQLRQRRSKGLTAPADARIMAAADTIMTGGSDRHPTGERGVSQGHPGGVSQGHGVSEGAHRGVRETPLLTRTHNEERGAAPTSNGVSDRHPGPRSNGKTSMAASLNPEVAYVERNITITPSGRLVIGNEFRDELRQAFTDGDINGALDCTLAAMGANRNKVQIAAQIRRQCVFRKSDAKVATKGSNKPKLSRW